MPDTPQSEAARLRITPALSDLIRAAIVLHEAEHPGRVPRLPPG